MSKGVTSPEVEPPEVELVRGSRVVRSHSSPGRRGGAGGGAEGAGGGEGWQGRGDRCGEGAEERMKGGS